MFFVQGCLLEVVCSTVGKPQMTKETLDIATRTDDHESKTFVIEKYYKALVAVRDHLANQVRSLSANSLIANRQAGEELADIGSDMFARETDLSLMGEEARRFHDVQRALDRIEDGTYAICLDCGLKIQEGRLEAKPWATYCIECKSIREKNGGLRPDLEPEEK